MVPSSLATLPFSVVLLDQPAPALPPDPCTPVQSPAPPRLHDEQPLDLVAGSFQRAMARYTFHHGLLGGPSYMVG